MSAGKFWILIGLAAFIAVLVGFEIISDSQVLRLTESLTANQNNLSRAQQQESKLREMVQRLVVASQDDPDVVDLLARHKIHINKKGDSLNPETTPPATSGVKPPTKTPAPPVPAVVQ